MARLILNAGTPQAKELVLKDGVTTIGRADTNDLPIPEPSISGSHCEIIKADGCVRLRDRGSTNGTFVNGARVTEVELKGHQTVQLGAIPLVFEGDSHSIPLPPPPTRVTVKPAGLRVAGAAPKEEAPPSESEPPPMVPAVAAPPDAKCKYHPRTLARWICTGCRKTYCDLCVAERQTGHTHQKFCRSCGAVAAQLEVHIQAPEEKSFYRELPGAFAYPARGAGVMVIIFATLLFAALEFLSLGFIGLLIKALAIGYLYSYMQTILHSTAAGDNELPGMPAMDDLLSGFFRLAGTVLISFGPALVLAYFAVAQAQPWAGIALIPAVIFGSLYLPMAFLVVAMKDNVMAANPLIVIPSILRVPLEYLVAAIVVAAIFGVRYLGDALTSGMAGDSMMGTSVSKMLLLFGLRAVWAFFSVYLLTVTMRILGLLYLTKRERLGW